MRIAIVGAGAMGCLFAYFFHRAGYNPWLLDKSEELVDTVISKGLTVETATATHHLSLRTITTRPEDIGEVDLVLVAVKAYDTGEAIHAATVMLGKETLVLSLQNGLYNIERIASVVGKNRVVAGVTSHGSTWLSRGHIRHCTTF